MYPTADHAQPWQALHNARMPLEHGVEELDIVICFLHDARACKFFRCDCAYESP